MTLYKGSRNQFCRQLTGHKVCNVLGAVEHIQLEQILSLGDKPQVVLIEGKKGCGKSTLTLHIIHQWGQGKLFQEYKLVILVQLRDPAVLNAKSVADLLPHCQNAQEVADELIAREGKDILWVLDGWNELPANSQQPSIPHQLIQSEICPQSTIIVTSLPLSSCDLYPFVSSTIEVLGFTFEVLQEYLADCLNENTETINKSLQIIKETPSLMSGYYLPLDVNTLMHCFHLNNNAMIHYQHKSVHSLLVHDCIVNHLNTHMGGKSPPLTSLQNLPETVKEPFYFLCKLAYEGVMANKVSFSNLPSDINMVGILQGEESCIARIRSVYYSLCHQEYLAAFYISTQMEVSQQTSVVQELFHHPYYGTMLQFYAAITKLQAPGISHVLSQVVTEYIELKKDATTDKHQECRKSLLTLINCLYEAQNPSLCQDIAKQLRGELDLSFTTLTPVDSRAVGYFLSCISSSCEEFVVNLNFSSVADEGCKFLVRELCSCKCSSVTLKLNLQLAANDIHEQGARELADLLCSTNMVQRLILQTSDLGDKGVDVCGLKTIADAMCVNESVIELDISYQWLEITDENGPSLQRMLENNKTLQILQMGFNRCTPDRRAFYISQGLKYNTTLETLDLSNSDITPVGIEFLSTGLKSNNSLRVLDLRCNSLHDDGINHLADVLKLRNLLKKLNVSSCGISSPGIQYLATALNFNDSLEELDISSNEISDSGIECLAVVLQTTLSLRKLNVSSCQFTSKGAASLATALQVNQSIEELDISSNKVNDCGFKFLATILEHTKSLSKLKLSDCGLTSKSSEYLASFGAATSSKSLEDLDMSENHLGDESVEHIACALKLNYNLKRLDLSECGLTDSGLENISTSLGMLKVLRIGGNPAITKKGVAVFAGNLKNNKTLVKLTIPGGIGTAALSLQQSICKERRRNGLPDIEVDCKSYLVPIDNNSVGLRIFGGYLLFITCSCAYHYSQIFVLGHILYGIYPAYTCTCTPVSYTHLTLPTILRV